MQQDKDILGRGKNSYKGVEENIVAEAEQVKVSTVGEKGFTLYSEGDWKQLTVISKGVTGLT